MYKKSAGWDFFHPAELFCLIGVHGDHTGAEHLAENRRADRRAAAALLDHDDEGEGIVAVLQEACKDSVGSLPAAVFRRAGLSACVKSGKVPLCIMSARRPAVVLLSSRPVELVEALYLTESPYVTSFTRNGSAAEPPLAIAPM